MNKRRRIYSYRVHPVEPPSRIISMKILTDLHASDIPVLPGMSLDVLKDPSIKNEVIVVTCNETTVLEAFKLISMQQKIIDKGMAKIIYLDDRPNKNVA